VGAHPEGAGRLGGKGGVPGRIILSVALAFLVCGLTVAAIGNYGIYSLFIPALMVLLPLSGLRILSNPVQVFCVFLLVIVNLDFFRIPQSRLTADILTSSMLLYAVLVRVGLEGRAGLRNPVGKAFLVYLAVTFLSVVLSVNVASSVKNWGRDFEYWIFFLFLLGRAMTEGDRRAIVKAVMLSSVIPCLLGLAGMIFRIDALYGQVTPVAGGEAVRRINSTLSHPVTLSLYLALIGSVTLSMIMNGTWYRRRLLIPLFLLQLSVLYLTFGRTGWAQLAVAAIALFWMMGKRKVVFVVLPALAAGLFAILPAFLARIQQSFQSGDNSLVWRFGLWAYALGKVPQKPLFGSGQDTFISYVSYETGFASHQTWIGLLVETGILGLGAFLVLQIVLGLALARGRRNPATAGDPLLLGIYAGWIGILVGTFAGDPFDLPGVSIYFWTLLALALRGPLPGAASPARPAVAHGPAGSEVSRDWTGREASGILGTHPSHGTGSTPGLGRPPGPPSRRERTAPW
jgi:O-antigen ligase